MPVRIPMSRNQLTAYVDQCISRSSKVEARIENALSKVATVVITDTSPGALATAIAAAVQGDVIEVQTNATYSPITLPNDKTLVIRAGKGFGPRLAGTRCVKLADGATEHVFSGFSFEGYTTANPNYQGAAVDHETLNAKTNDCVFHNCNFGEVTAGSAVMLSYHWSEGGDNYANPPQPSELSDTISFIDCRFYKAGAEGIEGGCLSLRAYDHPLILRCQVNGDDANSRGIQLQNCTDFLIEHCTVRGFGGGNGEGIKIDSIGSPVAVRESGIIISNSCSECIEGIDIDDDADVVVIDNVCYGCVDEGISLDGSGAPPTGAARSLCSGNICFDCGVGILAEAGSSCELQYNDCYGNGTDFSVLNGYVLPSSNVTTLKGARRITVPQGIPLLPSVPANWAGNPVQMQDAIDRIAAALAGVLGVPIP